MTLLPEFFEAARYIQVRFDDAKLGFCFIGGLSLQRWGEPRYTSDVDLTVACRFGDEESVISAIAAAIPPRLSDAIEFARTRRVYLGKLGNIPIDASLGGTDFEARMIDGASLFEFLPGVPLRTCPAEYLVAMKTIAGRGQDWVDIENVLHRQFGKLDWPLIERELAPMLELKGEPESLEKLRQCADKVERFVKLGS